MRAPKLPTQLSGRDLKLVARLVGKYGRGAVVKAAQTTLPSKRGRPAQDDDPYDIAWFLHEYEERHRLAGSKRPLQDALNDLYDVIGDPARRGEPGFYKRWCDTQLRKIRSDQKQRRGSVRQFLEWQHEEDKRLAAQDNRRRRRLLLRPLSHRKYQPLYDAAE
jgi:hypothetical protein